ncbi:PP2C family protein-serine/threonine phosphatase [Paenibacillus rhizoplanae]
MDSLSCTQDPVQVLNDLNSKALQHLGEDYVAGCCFLLDFKTGQLKAAGAGINEFLYVPRGRGMERVIVKGAPLGMFESSEFEEKTLPFESGDRFCFL